MDINEGFIINDSKVMLKSEMIRQLWRIGPTTPQQWERRVFEALAGKRREEVDWNSECNQVAYHGWIRTFDEMIAELEDDGYVKVSHNDDGSRTLMPVEVDPGTTYNHLAYPTR